MQSFVALCCVLRKPQGFLENWTTIEWLFGTRLPGPKIQECAFLLGLHAYRRGLNTHTLRSTELDHEEPDRLWISNYYTGTLHQTVMVFTVNGTYRDRRRHRCGTESAAVAAGVTEKTSELRSNAGQFGKPLRSVDTTLCRDEPMETLSCKSWTHLRVALSTWRVSQ